jgi:hypothetical protein
MVAAQCDSPTEVPAVPVSQLGPRTPGDWKAKEAVSPKPGEPADQCRELGLVVGDTICGRETHAYVGWQDAELTLLWIGKTVAVFSERYRGVYSPEWSEPVETAQWTLEYRDWRKVP